MDKSRTIILRKLPDEDDLFLNTNFNVIRIKGVDIPKILSKIERPVFLNEKRKYHVIGTIKLDLLTQKYKSSKPKPVLKIKTMFKDYMINKSMFIKVWNGEIPYCYALNR